MLRTQISLTDDARALLDAEAARTGRSLSSLIREAVAATYGHRRNLEGDTEALREAFGAWGDGPDGESWVDERRSGARLGRVTG